MPESIRIDDRLINQIQPMPLGGRPGPLGGAVKGPSFAEQLKQAQQARPGSIKFSAHAMTRVESRNIQITPADLKRVEGAVDRAAGKGARESLVMLDQTALVVSIPNRTVITVVDQENLKQNVFTNIDSAVIA